MVIIIMHKGLAYRKGSGGRGMFHLIIFVTTSLRFKWFCSIMAMKSRKGINGVCLSTKAAENFQGTLEHLRESFIQVFFSCAVLVGSAECIIGAAVWVTVIISQFLPLKYWRHCHQAVLCLIFACARVRTCDHVPEQQMEPQRTLMTRNIVCEGFEESSIHLQYYHSNLSDSLHISMKLFESGGWGGM